MISSLCNYCWVQRWNFFENLNICRSYGQLSRGSFLWNSVYGCHYTVLYTPGATLHKRRVPFYIVHRVPNYIYIPGTTLGLQYIPPVHSTSLHRCHLHGYVTWRFAAVVNASMLRATGASLHVNDSGAELHVIRVYIYFSRQYRSIQKQNRRAISYR